MAAATRPGPTAMLHGKRLIVVMPAYNAAQTLRQTYAEIPHEYVDEVILVDDGSFDATVALARELDIHTVVHARNRGYGANQKTCYRTALERGADIVVMLHPDYQYSPRLITALATLITSGHYDVALGSRILGGASLAGGMPHYKYVANRVLTLVQNLVLRAKLSEYHTGYRAFSREVLLTLPLEENADDFVFDNQVLAQCLYFGYRIGEISCPTRYFAAASSISFVRSVRYGFGVLATTLAYAWSRYLGRRLPLFDKHGRRLALTRDGRGA
jgi:glycosyltransferase involved in cell wall biosynthesis